MISKGSLITPLNISNLHRVKPILFDVSLRDGIQNAKLENYPTERKKTVFHDILQYGSPTNLEIGSLANPNILPIMADTMELFEYVTDFFDKIDRKQRKKVYVLIPSIKRLEYAIQNNIRHMSFITSVSDAFQKKNTNRSIEETKCDFKQMFLRLNGEPGSQKFVKKLYISCIDTCPILGKIDIDHIVNEIFYYTDFSFDELCISDTCGELLFENFKEIIEKCIVLGISLTRFSVHLHVSPEKRENIEKILFYCFSIGIHKFDVSYLETGGCSVTMDSPHANLSYELFHETLQKYERTVCEKLNEINFL